MGQATLPDGLRPASSHSTGAHAPSRALKHVRGHGGTLAHVLGALGTFRFRHGHWPNRLYLYPETLAALVQDLTPLGFYRIQRRIDVAADLERDLFCVDDRGNVSIYRVQAPSDSASIDAAAVWLGLSPPAACSPDGRPRPCATPKPPR